MIVALSRWEESFEAEIDRLDGQSEPGVFEDYVVFYAAGSLVLDGDGDKLYDIEALRSAEYDALGRFVNEGVLVYLNPPFVAALYAPLALLPIVVAGLVIYLLVCVSVVAGGLLTKRFLGLNETRQSRLFWFGFLTLGPMSWMAAEGQFSMLLYLGWFGFAVAQASGRQRLSGACLALLLIKPHMALIPVALLLWQRRWQSLSAFGTIAVLFVAASIIISGPQVLVDYPRFLMETSSWDHQWGIHLTSMYGWNGPVAIIFGSNHAATTVLPMVLSLLTLGAFARAARYSWQPGQPAFYRLMAAAVLATLLISPHLYLQDLSLVALAIAFAAKASLIETGTLGRWPLVFGAAWLTQLYARRLVLELSLNLPTPLMAIILIALIVSLLRREGASSRLEASEDPLQLAPAA
ncbi:MAG TPA: glycosyltransferase family 87 protein [Dehalococcoidia bacterium]|nr:glycosyltransferase family 87 protein [Dehalococcoidia bacterium]